MNIHFFILVLTISIASSSKPKVPSNTTADIKKILEEHEQALSKMNKPKNSPVKITNYSSVKITPAPLPEKQDEAPKIISSLSVKKWAEDISKTLFEIERKVVRREELLKGFGDVKMEVRDGSAIVDRTAKRLEELLLRRVRAAEMVMRKAEEIATPKLQPPESYAFDNSIDLDQTKQMWQFVEEEKGETLPKCISVQRVKPQPSQHFDTPVSLEKTSVHVSAEVFPCGWRVLPHIAWTEGLLSTFQKNYAQDSTIGFQYFCSAKGFLRQYPASLWSSNFKTDFSPEDDVYDCRLRPWFVSAEGAPRDVLILIDASGSMNRSVNEYVAEQFTLAMLSALTDDDQVNVLRFNVQMESPISCFNDRLVAANHVNSAAMMAAMKPFRLHNETWMVDILESAVRLLQRQHGTPDRAPSCQQAIVLLTDSMEENHTMLMRHLDPYGRIRLFTLWLHDPNGLRDNTRAYAEHMSCDRDGYFAEFITHADVTEQVMRILRIMERPLVAQRKERLRVFSDVYAHVEDPRRGEQQWKTKENFEQQHRYKELRKDKAKLLSPAQLFKDYMHQESLDKYGFYYEGNDLNYRLQISVSVPVFEDTTIENITIVLDEEKQRNSTRTYPVNRLLGVAGVDIPIDHLKLMLPYHQIGGGGSLFLIDHRGNIVLHDNIKSTFDGDIIKPGYRTVDIIDLEQPAIYHPPRHYPRDWLKFRKSLVIEKEKGNMTMYGKNIFEDGLRVHMEMREYHWKRVLDHYTAVVVLPPYSRQHVVPETAFTMQAAEKALKALSGTDFAVQPDWLYCRHIEPHFDNREAEVLHFLRRRSDEPDFAMKKTKYDFSPIPPTLLEKTYQCDEELMAKLCKEAIATEKWAREHEEPDTDRDCSTCELGSSTAFFASESGLSRWQQYHATSQHASPPSGAVWSQGPTEAWYRRAAARPGTLVLHAPVTPVRRLRNTYLRPPPLGVKSEWLTAARTLASDKGLIGVAGYHFYPQHLIELLISVTEMPCYAENKALCKPRCEDTWSCVLVDEDGWVVARNSNDSSPIEDVREHLATLHPAAMSALQEAGVFHVNWVHDYQGVCFPPWFNKATPMIPSLLKSLWYSVKAVFRITHEVATLLAFVSTTGLVYADTEKEREKRRRRLKHDYEREKYEQLYDPRVLINKTVFAACDRTRPFYRLQHDQKSIDALSKTPTPAQLADCSLPLVGAFVPNTNLLLLALYNCDVPYSGKPLPNPLINQQYLEDLEPFDLGVKKNPASKLACWRNRVPLPGRLPKTKCFPHDYSQEVGYRQCGPWLPDEINASPNGNPGNPAPKYISLFMVFLSTLLKYTLS